MYRSFTINIINMKKIILAALLLSTTLLSQAQNDGAYYWKMLGKINFATQINPETGDVVYAPVFGKAIKEMEGKEIILKGYILPVPSRDGTFILSAFPYSSCYYCGGAGPETVIEVTPKFPILSRGSKPVTIKGKLKLNQPYNMLYLPYFLKDAEPYVE